MPKQKHGLDEMRRLFVEAFMGRCKGNGTQAAIAAGYAKGSAHVTASRLLRDAKVRRAIEERVKADPHVMDREQIQNLLSAIAEGRGRWILAKLRDRLKALELLGKSQKVFTDRVEHSFDHEGHLSAIEERRRAGAPIAGGKK